MAANPDMEVSINDLVNFAVDQDLVPLEEAEAANQALVAAYVKGAAHRDEDDTPYAATEPYGFHRVTAPPLDVIENLFKAIQYTVEQDPDWDDSPCFKLVDDLEIALFYRRREEDERVRTCQIAAAAFEGLGRRGSVLH